MNPVLLWLHNDFRLDDHTAFTAALEEGNTVIPVYLHRRVLGAASAWWLHHSLDAYRARLRQAGADVVIRRVDSATDAAQALSELMAHYQTRRIMAQVPPQPFARFQQQVLNLLPEAEFTGFPNHTTSIDLDRLLTHQGTAYRVFTAFWKASQATHVLTPPLPPVQPRPCIMPPEHVDLADLQLLPRIPWDQGFHDAWRPGEQEAQRKLQEWLRQGLSDYAEQRDLPAMPGTSRLSPHLHFGEISVRRVLWEIAEQPGSARFAMELGWRDFAYYLLRHFPHSHEQAFRPEFAQLRWEQNPVFFERWTRGQTGFPLVDAGMRELWRTGWMHNRVRMVAASFLTKNGLIAWQEGARWFEDTLVDADLAINRASWQWVAGCGADAAPYFRIFNPLTQGEKFDPEAHYIQQWIPELAKVPARRIHRLEALPAAYPRPVVELASSRQRCLERFAAAKASAKGY